ncbi:carboxylesterase/lipase family protein [Prescottella equi]|uniref:carboxylesterase/lipase family protein n=1 Tax=Rhodococcus hoagii TaxID=43767 RepID=UPI000A0FE941|nr:carboxylesterase/lipase family protein [Prescottella equi]NKR71095.1 carboxylesterase family protein [Prescottella equi]NKR92465.1 carboxylesterase family protein [Prescottella equi]NKS17514.1 carboxylesterase family protein [Prescottella equi]ORK00196.1 carboxylesterase [Prescottella equi]
MSDDHAAVTYADGTVRGRRLADLLSWRGIPYATPPVGPLRLRAPRPVSPWAGVRDALSFGPPAPQRRRRGSEDCLTLNVLRQAEPSAAPRPVMVYIHGGAHTAGTSAAPMYSGASLVRRGDVVFVSLGYRLGALGYLDFREFSTPEHTFDVNLGLRDQIAALEWVQRNIAAFGGDPSNVTLFGESAGADAVVTLMCTPAARGLFARAIAQSPPPATSNGTDLAGLWAREFLDLAGVSRADAAHYLTTASPEALVRTAATLSTRGADEVPGVRPFAPVADGAVLPDHPLDAFEAGTEHRVPLIIGTNAQEGRIFPRMLDILPTDRTRIEKMFEGTDPAIAARVTAAYPGYPRRRAAADLGGDVVFWEPSLRCAHAHTRHTETYMYRYDFAPRLLHLAGLGATHATELFAVFGRRGVGVGTLTALGGRKGLRAVTDTMQRHWLEFAHSGRPLDSWPRYSSEHRDTLIIDEVCRVECDPARRRREAWLGYRHRH